MTRPTRKKGRKERTDMENENEVLEGGAPEETVAPQAEAETETGSENAGAAAGTEEAEARARNARMAAARRTGEAAARKAIDAEFAELGIVGSDGRPISSKAEAIEYFKAVKAQEYETEAKKTGKTVEEVRAEAEAMQRGRAAMRDERSKAEREQFMQRDFAEFREIHPDVDCGKLVHNEAFLKFCGSRLGKEPMSELYDDFTEIVGGAEKAGSAKAGTKKERATGSGSGTVEGSLTASQQKALDEWNQRNPRMKMTAKEFLKYES